MDPQKQELIPWVPLTTEDHQSVLAEVERLLASPHFCNSKRYPAFLRYVVEAKLAGKDQQIKERTLGVEVFQRPPNYDTSSDTVVRYTAGEVRKRLLAYYSELSGGSALQISLPVGSYIPEFFRGRLVPSPASETPLALELPAEVFPVPAPALNPSRRLTQNKSLVILWLVVVAGGVLMWAVLLRPHFTPKTTLDQFWSPLTSVPGRVFVYPGTDNAYMPTLVFTRRFKQSHHLEEDQRNGTLIPLPPLNATDTLTSYDLYPKNDSLVDTGDLAACFDVASLLARHNKTPDVRVGNELSAEDLAGSPAVFIGAFSNRWTMQVSKSLPFRFDLSQFDFGTIAEEGGQKRVWKAKVELNGEVSVYEDYSIAARLVDSSLGKPVIIAAGLMAPGSRAASNFITSPELLEAFARNAPSDWSRKNLEVVLRTEVVKGHPGPPTIVAVKYW